MKRVAVLIAFAVSLMLPIFGCSQSTYTEEVSSGNASFRYESGWGAVEYENDNPMFGNLYLFEEVNVRQSDGYAVMGIKQFYFDDVTVNEVTAEMNAMGMTSKQGEKDGVPTVTYSGTFMNGAYISVYMLSVDGDHARTLVTFDCLAEQYKGNQEYYDGMLGTVHFNKE